MKHRSITGFICIIFTIFGLTALGQVQSNVQFEDVARGDNSGFTYRRTPSVREGIYDAVRLLPVFNTPPTIPVKGRGIPGVVIFDYDNDSDEDIYVTNGPGTSNSLYANQWVETGQLTFVEMGPSSGADAVDQDSSGACAGDIDNDGDMDLYVLGSLGPNRLFQNNGDGTFTDITDISGTGGGSIAASSAVMGDVNNDGLLDIFVGNFGTFEDAAILNMEPFALSAHNQLFLNRGGNQFEDVSESSGVKNLNGLAPEDAGKPGPTHAVAMVDYDLDGDIDIFTADDQAAIAPARTGGVDRGLLHLFENDGIGHFTDVNVQLGINHSGAWMGLSFADYNHDGLMDFFASNLGVYTPFPRGDTFNMEQHASRWYLARPDGGFDRPPLNNVGATPFGWGAASEDYDNDGHTDIIFYGSMDVIGFLLQSNPGAFLKNNGNAIFSHDSHALANSTDHTRRSIQGFGAGDLNGDGFVDYVTASNFNIQESIPMRVWHAQGGDFDGVARWLPTIGNYGDPPAFRYDPDLPRFLDGDLSVEVSNGDSDNNHLAVDLIGAKGLTTEGRVNRSGVGAVIFFRPQDMETAMKPVETGNSYAGQHSMTNHFGMGSAKTGIVEVMWPGGVRTILYGVNPKERILLPELPLSYNDYDTPWPEYRRRIEKALTELVDSGALTQKQADRIGDSARWARLSGHCPF